jgi:hypothetical protein
MAVYRFQVAMPVDTLLARDYITNTLHFDHVSGDPLTPALDDFCDDLADLYQSHYGSVAGEVRVKAYKVTTGALGPPDSSRVKSAGGFWSASWPREIACCLSFARNKSIPSQRGRIYLMPNIKIGSAFTIAKRPSTAVMDWALDFFRATNDSFPDLGGIDWKFGIYSPSQGQFHQASQAWVDDEWDTVRSRGLQPTSRVQSTREG